MLDITLVHPGLPTGAASVTDLALAAKVKRPEALQIVGVEVNPGDESDWENVPVYWRGDAIKELGDKTLVIHPHIWGTQGHTGTCKTRTPPHTPTQVKSAKSPNQVLSGSTLYYRYKCSCSSQFSKLSILEHQYV